MSDLAERFTVSCPKCTKRYVLTAAAIGKRATCKCGNTFVVQKPEEDLEAEEEDGGDYGIKEG